MFEFYVRDDVTHDGRDECGYPIERLMYYVVCESPSGRRWMHHAAFFDNGVWQEGQRKADQLLRRIQNGVSALWYPAEEYWIETDPAYGSDAYQGLDDQKYFRNREIMEAHERGEINERTAFQYMSR